MNLIELLTAKPVLIGLHLGFAILGIDAFLWLLGEYFAGAQNARRRIWAAAIGSSSFIMSWIFGGYYYLTYYGKLVKPTILAGSAPWAHTIMTETKEHIFLFLVPLAITSFFLSRVDESAAHGSNLRKSAMRLAGAIAFIGLLIGLMGYTISAAARWGIK